MAVPLRSPGLRGDPSSLTELFTASMISPYTAQAQAVVVAGVAAVNQVFASMRSVLIYNDGVAVIHIALNRAAVVTDFPLAAGNAITLLFNYITGISVITVAGNANVYMWGFR